MRVLFAGSGSWATDVLEACWAEHHTTVVTYKNEQNLRMAKAFGPTVTSWVLGKGKSAQLEEWPPAYAMPVWKGGFDILLVSNWRHRIPEGVLKTFPAGCINIHRGALPRYAGFSPINWAVGSGECEARLTAHLMTPELDEGPVIAQASVPIGPEETATQVYLKTRLLVPSVVRKALDRLGAGGASDLPHGEGPVRLLPRRTPETLEIDWNKPAEEIYNLIRAQSPPFPSAFFRKGGRKYYVSKAMRTSVDAVPSPGTVVGHTGRSGALVRCLDSTIELMDLFSSQARSPFKAASILEVGTVLRQPSANPSVCPEGGAQPGA